MATQAKAEPRRRLGRDRIDRKLAEIGRAIDRGVTVVAACRAAEVSVPSYYRWQATRRSGAALPVASGERARAAILASARAIFLRDGFGAGLDKVARRAGVSRQTLYNLFGSKERLFGEVVQSVYRETVEPILVLDLGAPFDLFLDTCARHLLQLMIDPDAAGLFRITLGEFRDHPELAALAYALRSSPVVPNVASLIARRLEAEMAAGRIDPVESQVAAELFVGSFTAHPRHRALLGLDPPAPDELDRRLDLAIRLFMGGLNYDEARTSLPGKAPVASPSR